MEKMLSRDKEKMEIFAWDFSRYVGKRPEEKQNFTRCSVLVYTNRKMA